VTAGVVVIGGGAIGVCAPLELARAGARAALVERGPELASGCSAGNAGLIHHSVPLATPANLLNGLRWIRKRDSLFYLRPRPAVVPWLVLLAAACTPSRAEAAGRVLRELAAASLDLHAKLAEEGVETTFERRGTLLVHLTEEGFDAGRSEAEPNELAGIRSQVLGPERARRLEPALAGPFRGAIHYPDEAMCDPVRFVEAVGRAAAETGARVRTRVEVLALRRRGRRIDAVETTAGDLRAGEVVLAAGAWTAELARPLGVFVPLEGGKGYHVDLEPGPDDLRIPVFVHETKGTDG